MANNLINNSIITKEAVSIRRNTNEFVEAVDRQYEDMFARRGAKVGATINIRLPNDYVVQDGPIISPEATVERSIPLTLTKRKAVPMVFSTQERTINIDDFSARYIAPAVNNLTGQVALDLMQTVTGVSNLVFNTDSSGAISTPVAANFLEAGAILDDRSCPRDERSAILSPFSNAKVVSGMSGLFNPVGTIGRQTTTGLMSQPILGVNRWATDQTVSIHTTGSYDSKSTFVSSSTTSTGIPVTISGLSGPHTSSVTVSAINGTISAGDVITFAGVYSVNAVNKQSTGRLAQFSVLSDVASGGTTLEISPALIGPDSSGNPVPYQTVASVPTTTSTVNLVAPAGSVYRKNLIFHKKALTLATVDLDEVRNGVIDCGRANLDGVSMRTLTYYDGQPDNEVTRLDILYGTALIRPDWCVIVADSIS